MNVVVCQFDGVSTMRTLPLAAGLLVASSLADPRLAGRIDVTLRTGRDAPDTAVSGLGEPDIAGLSLYCWNERYTLEVARRLKQRRPGTLVVAGGPSVPRRDDRIPAFLAAHPAVDVLVLGEGEGAWCDLLAARLDGRRLEDVPGLVVRIPGGGWTKTSPRDRLRDFSGTQSPYLAGTFDPILDAQPGAVQAVLLETTRGCPFGCTFCDWGQAIESRVHELPEARVHAELRWAAERRIPYVYFVDANFGIRRRDPAIAEYIARLARETGFPRYVYFHLTKNASERHLSIVETLRGSGIGCELALSAQDHDPRVLTAIRRDNIDLARAGRLRRLCHERGIPTMNEVLLGLPEQTYDRFADSLVEAVSHYPADTFFLYLCRLLENAELASPAQRERHGLVTRLCPVGSFAHAAFDAHVDEFEEVVVGTATLDRTAYERCYRYGYLLSALCNRRLLDRALTLLVRGAGVDLRTIVEALVDALLAAAPETTLGRIAAAFDRHLDSLFDGGLLALPSEGAGPHRWAIEDAVLIEVLRDPEAFYAGIRAALEGLHDDPALVAETIAWQAALLPAPGGTAGRVMRWSRDYAAWEAVAPGLDAPGLPDSTGIETLWTPAPALVAIGDLPTFVQVHATYVHGHVPTGWITVTARDEPRLDTA